MTTTKRRISDTESRRNKRLEIDGDSAMDIGVDNVDDLNDEMSMLDTPNTSISPDNDSNLWLKAISKVVSSVVSIQFSSVTYFDTEEPIVSEATGFVVDSKRGLILTNRHVIGPGPFHGYVVFDNHEEVEVKPLYRDPIHDFGFLQFDVNKIRYMKLQELTLKPELAKVGTEIRVIGNDSGEKLSILAGFISRIDRNTPEYGTLTYTDFNTEYIQAAASAKGGSSGSPVVNQDGYAIALQAGGNTAATDYFLPVFRPLRALKCIQNSLPITRGDIQVLWQLRPFDRCRRLGLSEVAEARARELFPDKNGLLVASVALPEGPADGLIKEGDILLSINDEPIGTFIKVDELLDDNVGNELKFVIQRGKQELVQTIKIGDLHAITPSKYVEVAGGSFHTLSYQVAIDFGIPVKGVYINCATGSFNIPEDDSGCILQSIDGKDTPDLETFIEIMKSIPNRSKVTMSFKRVADLHTENYQEINILRNWQHSSFVMVSRNDETGLWDFKTLQSEPIAPLPLEAKYAKFFDIPIEDPSKDACKKLSRSLVAVKTNIAFTVDAFLEYETYGNGVVIDAENGYVLVAKADVPHDLSDISIIFADSFDTPAKVVFSHPYLGYTIVQYDPKLVKSPVETPKFGTKPLKKGENSFFVGFNRQTLVTEDVQVNGVLSFIIPASLNPRYRGCNFKYVSLNANVANKCTTGVLCDNDATIRSFWLCYLGETVKENTTTYYRMGLDVTYVNDVIQSLKKGEVPEEIRIIDAEFSTLPAYQARTRGVSQEWITKLEENSEDEVKCLSVFRVSSPPPGFERNPLKAGDIVLSINDKIAKDLTDLQIMYQSESLKLKVIRQKKELDLIVPTIDYNRLSTKHIVYWCGASIQAPHHGVRQLMTKVPSEVYITGRSLGSPAYEYGLLSACFITHINDIETKDVDAFIKIIKELPPHSYIKIRVVTFDNVPYAFSIKPNYHYFPTAEFKKIDNEWKFFGKR